MLKFAVGTVLLLGFSVHQGSALQCWECSSDIDRSCSDRFNVTDYYRYGGLNPYNQQQQFYDPYNQRPVPPYDNRDYSTYRPTESYRDPNRDPNNGYRDPNYRGNNRDDYNDRRRDPYYRDDDRDSRYRDRDFNNNNRTYDRDRDYDRRGGYDRYNSTLDYRNNNNTNASGVYYDNRDRNYQQRSPSNRDYNYQNRGDYNNRDPNRNPSDRDPNNRDFDRDNRDYRNRDYAGRDPNYRDPYLDRTRDPYNNRDYNRDYNNRDGNRDPYFDRDQRDRYDRDPNNRDYPPPRDYNRDYNQGRPAPVDPNYPPRDVNYQRAQAQLAATQSGPRLITCNEEDARLRRMRNVCMKKVQRIGEYQLTYIRRCTMIPFEKEIGTCQDAVARGISLDFCEYCEYDGCNSATGLKFNIFLASLVPLVLLWVYSS